MSTLDNIITVLGLLSSERDSLRVGEVARETGIAKATVSRILAGLAAGGLLARDPDGVRYRAGAMGLTLGELYLRRSGAFRRLAGLSATLAQETGFVSYICKLEGTVLIILARNHGSYPLRLLRDVGSSVPPFHTSSGRAILARMPAPRVHSILGADPVWRDRIPQARAILSDIRQVGLSIHNSSGTVGVSAIAAAIAPTGSGDPMAVSISFPQVSADIGLQIEMARRLRSAIGALGHELGDAWWAEFHAGPASGAAITVQTSGASATVGEI